jgi:hypothetical protein
VSVRRLQGWEPSERTVYEYGPDGRLSSSITTLESEYGPTDLEWLEALLEVEREQGPHGFPMTEATDTDADPDRPESHFRFVAGTQQIAPEGDTVWSPSYDFAEKARLDFIADLRGEKRDPHAGLVVPVQKYARTPTTRKRRRKASPPTD